MKKIKLNETDLMKIVKRVLNEQEDKEFNEDEIDILHLIFERELKFPFRKGEKDGLGRCLYYNRDGEEIGRLVLRDKYFAIKFDPFWINIKDKVCQVFKFSHKTVEWLAIKPYLKSWLEYELNIEIRFIGPY